MPGTTAPARDSSLADLIGPGDAYVPDAPRSNINVGEKHEKIEGNAARVWVARKLVLEGARKRAL